MHYYWDTICNKIIFFKYTFGPNSEFSKYIKSSIKKHVWDKFVVGLSDTSFKFWGSIVDLQYCTSFRLRAKWIGCTYTYTYSFFPIYIIMEYWVDLPVLCNRSLLVTSPIYSSVHVPIPSSKFIPAPSVSPLATLSLIWT